MGWLVKIRFLVTHLPYVQGRGRTSALTFWAICSITRLYVHYEVFRENLIFSTRPPPILQTTPKPIKGLSMVS
jgi:hypothetical protein